MSELATVSPRPEKAGRHCRHYSWYIGTGPGDSGPACALARLGSEPGAAAACMPVPGRVCAFRAEWTDEERNAWDSWRNERLSRLFRALDSLPPAIPEGTTGAVVCPNCGGALHFCRWQRGAMVRCETADCCGARLNIDAGAEWPARPGKALP